VRIHTSFGARGRCSVVLVLVVGAHARELRACARPTAAIGLKAHDADARTRGLRRSRFASAMCSPLTTEWLGT
jgi:hypothetical protein